MTSSPSHGNCPDPGDIDAFVRGEIAPSSLELVENHLAACVPCRELLSALVKLESPAQEPPASASAAPEGASAAEDIPLHGGARIGRYIVLQCLGAGGMGIVYAAYDPELDRKVALKVLGDFGQADNAPLRERLRKEAQAMAQVAHPNVVTVYDVGMWGDRIFIAMEMVEGRTLSDWLALAPRPWDEVVARFLPAGHGLAAVHAAGLVHRDFKPSNVFIGADERVRVGDFGLAAIIATGASTAPAVGQRESVRSAESRSTTASVAGTPFYMAPEQLLGDSPDSRSDQFSFCVALYTAITGQHPFAGFSLDNGVTATGRCRAGTPARLRSMPRWLHHLLLRGLSVDPADRYPSMPALLERLAHPPRRWRAATTGAAAAGALLAASMLALPRLPRGHDGAGDRANKIAPVEVRYDAAVFAGAPDVLRAYDREWSVLHTDACETPNVRCALQATNLLRDAGFERAGHAWRPGVAGSAVQLSRLDGAVMLTTARDHESIAQEVPWIILPGTSYTFSVRVRAPREQGGVPGTLTLSAQGRGPPASSTTRFVVGPDWSPVSVTFSPKAHYSRFRAELSLDSSGSVIIDNAELTDTGLVDASFEDATGVYRSAAWRPYNKANDVRINSAETDAFDGSRVLQVQSATKGGSIAQDTTRSPVVGTTYTFAAWLRAGPGVSLVKGTLALWALGERQHLDVTSFYVGPTWTPVQVSLDIADYGYPALRAEIYLVTLDASLEVDATRLTPAGLADASFEIDASTAWYSRSPSGGAVTTRRVADPARDGGIHGLFDAGRSRAIGKDGEKWLRVSTRDRNGSIAQDLGRPLRDTTYSFSAWIRAVPGSTRPVSGALIVTGLGGAAEQALTRFVVSSQWTLVGATLEIRHDDHTGLRVEISLDEGGSELDVDGTRVTGANSATGRPA